MRVMHLATTSLMHKTFVLPLAQYQRSQGLDVELGCFDALPPGYDPAIADLERQGFTVRIFPFPYEIRPLQDALALIRLWGFFRKHRYDVVHTHTSKAGILGRAAAWLAGVPLIVHTAYDFHFRSVRPGARRAVFVGVERLAGALTDVLLYNTETVRDAASHHGIGRAARSVVIGSPLSGLERFQASPQEIEGLRQELGLARSVPIIACVSRLVDYKGVDTLLRVARRVVRDHPSVRFVIMGGGPLEARLRDMARELGLASTVLFTGFRQDERDVIRLLALADVFCLPTRREGFGAAFAEAMAMGCPAVGPAIAPVTTVVLDGQTGLLVPPEDEAAYASAVLRLLHDAELRTHLGAAGREHARSSLDPRKMYQAVTETYVLSRRAQSA
jgi:glycosyltransferase involved in cell wall biosynthesis